jgi:hypothetical protein
MSWEPGWDSGRAGLVGLGPRGVAIWRMLFVFCLDAVLCYCLPSMLQLLDICCSQCGWCFVC